MAAVNPGTVRFKEIGASPATPSPGYAIIYIKTDNVLYLKDDTGVEVALGSASSITQLVGEATGTGPGVTTVTLSNSAVIGKVLSGFTPGPNSTVLSTDTILQAIQKLQAQVNAVAATTLSGDVTGPFSSTVVATVGGSNSTNIHNAELAANAATDINTPSTIVKRDPSGNFTADIITASLNGNASTSTNFTGSLLGDVTGTQNATLIASNVVSNSKLTQMPTNTLKGNNTGLTANAADLTVAQVTALLNNGTSPVQIGTSNNPGSSNFLPRADHVHAHGAQTDPTLHALVTISTNGFMSATDKVKLNTISSAPGTNAQILISDGTNLNPQSVTGDISITNAGVVAVNTYTGIVPVTKGGTGQTSYTDGQLLIGNSTGNTLNKATLTPATGISIDNAGGGITIGTTGINPQVTKTANYTILSTDSIIFVDTIGGAFTLTLPNPSTLAGKIYRVIGTSGTMQANPVTLARFGSEKIEGLAADKLLQTNWGWFEITTNGTDWFVG